MMWIEKIRKSLNESGYNVCLEKINVTENPEFLEKYPSQVWQQFLDGYIHYLTVVAVNGKLLEDWYWDTNKIVEEVKRCIEGKKKKG